jgi:hypothetical protein
VPARKKSLIDFVYDRTFLARRHAELLVAEPLVRDRELRELQLAYRTETSKLERAAIARKFEKRVQTGGRPTGRLGETELEEWDARYGLLWRIRHDCLTDADKILMLVYVEEPASVDQIDDGLWREDPLTRDYVYVRNALQHKGPSDGLEMDIGKIDARLPELLQEFVDSTDGMQDLIDAAPDPPG